MKKGVVIVVVVVVGFGLLATLVLRGGSKSDPRADSEATAGKFEPLDACTLFTEAEAKEILGDNVTKGDDSTPVNSPDVSVSTCSYSNNTAVLSDARTITILVRTALTEAGAASNKAVFGGGRPAGTEAVNGYGSEAYYLPATGQLNTLKGDAWIIITSGGTRPGKSTLADVKRVADEIVL